jgi:Cu-processing system ATP-binding protein
MSAIDVTNAGKRYGDVTALDGLSLEIHRGSTVGVLGTNGAGKTTLFELLAGLSVPDAGTVSVLGREPTAGLETRRRVGYLPEHAGFPAGLTGREVLQFHARMRDVPGEKRARRVASVLETVGLRDAADRAVGGYSNGMGRRLGLGTVLVGDPAVLLLDEPTAGLDPCGVEALHDVIRAIANSTDVTVLFSSHVLSEVESLCDRAVIIDGGTVVAEGDIDALCRNGDRGATIDVTLSDAAAAGATALRSLAGVTEVHVDGADLTVHCDQRHALGVLQEIHQRAAVTRFAVAEPGLDASFRAAVADGGED